MDDIQDGALDSTNYSICFLGLVVLHPDLDDL